ncbi:ATPase [candidate division WOR-3 bacterium]|nr:ATPase [candidate division WOR-3 bacterium]
MDKIYKRRGGDSVLDDPYLSKIDYKDPTVCPDCEAVYHNKHWRFDDQLKHDIKFASNYEEKKCPACRKIEDNYPMGLVFLSGNFLLQHKKTILNTIRSEEKRAMQKNPLERIMEIEQKDDEYVIKTTTDALAHRIGKILHKSFKGELDYKFSDDQKLLRAFWSRKE